MSALEAEPEPESDDGPPNAKAPEPRGRKWRRIALEIGVVLLVFLGIRAWQSRDAPEGRAPALAGTGVEGEALSLAAASGEPVLVHFWATWCGVCRAEEGTIDGLAEDHRVITVASQSGPPERVAAYLREHELGFDAIADPRGELAQRWGVHAFPTSFVVRPDGTIQNVEVGYTTSLGLRARLFWASL